MAKRSLALSVLALFLVTSILVPLNWIPDARAAIEGVQPPADGDWLIDRDTNVSGETLILNGDIIVFNNSILNLTDSTIRMNSTHDGEFSIIVTDGARLAAENTTFTRNGDHAYSFLFDEGTTGLLEGSTVEYASGEGDAGVRRGDR